MLTVNRSGRPGLIALAARTVAIFATGATALPVTTDPAEQHASRERLFYEAVRAVAEAELAVARYNSACASPLPMPLETRAMQHESGLSSESEFTSATLRVIGESERGLT